MDEKTRYCLSDYDADAVPERVSFVEQEELWAFIYCGVDGKVRTARALRRGECGVADYAGVDCGEVFCFCVVGFRGYVAV